MKENPGTSGNEKKGSLAFLAHNNIPSSDDWLLFPKNNTVVFRYITSEYYFPWGCLFLKCLYQKSTLQICQFHFVAGEEASGYRAQPTFNPFLLGFPGGASGKESACQCRRCKRCGSDPWFGKIHWNILVTTLLSTYLLHSDPPGRLLLPFPSFH